MRPIRTSLILLLTADLFPQAAAAQDLPKDLRPQVGKLLNEATRREVSIGEILTDSINMERNKLIFFANMNCSYTPFRENDVAEIYQSVKALLPLELSKRKLQIRTDHHTTEELIPLALRSEKGKIKTLTFSHKVNNPLITRLPAPYAPTNGLQNRHIALWQSHGFYYEPKLTHWEWQRARTLQAAEDLYTQNYVLLFPVPMLGNTEATVLLPHEEDWQTTGIIVDSDGCRDGHSIYTG